MPALVHKCNESCKPQNRSEPRASCLPWVLKCTKGYRYQPLWSGRIDLGVGTLSLLCSDKSLNLTFLNDRVSEVSFEILSADGRSVFQFPKKRLNLGEQNESLPVDHLSPGNYFLKMVRGDDSEVVSFQKF